LGFEVDNVMDADNAYSKAQQMNPDIIIMDVFLKNKSSGIEAALRIREINNKTPIIFTTGNSYDDTIRLIKNINYCWVLNKPIDFEELVKLLNKF
jgi:DNA-binding response OmpR family regulator